MDVRCSAALPAKGQARALGKPGKQNALYLPPGSSAGLELALPAGRYQCEWLDPQSGKVVTCLQVSCSNRRRCACGRELAKRFSIFAATGREKVLMLWRLDAWS